MDIFAKSKHELLLSKHLKEVKMLQSKTEINVYEKVLSEQCEKMPNFIESIQMLLCCGLLPCNWMQMSDNSRNL